MTLTSLMAEHKQLGDGDPAPSHEAPRQPGSRLALGHFKPPRKPKAPLLGPPRVTPSLGRTLRPSRQ